MRILQVCSSTNIGGGEIHIADLCRGLIERGHELHLAARPKGAIELLLADVAIREIHYLPLRNAIDLPSAARLFQIIGSRNIDIVHTHIARDYPVCAMAARWTKAKLFITRHHYLPLKNNLFYRWLLSGATGVIAVSNSVKATLTKSLKLPEEKIAVVPNWIDINRFAHPIDIEQARKQFTIEKRLAVGCIGQITPAKGQEEFLRAASIICRARQDVQFIIAGAEQERGEPFTERLKALAESQGISERIRFLGPVREIALLLAALDVVVVPSWNEGFSLVVIEAMAAGRPCVATDIGGPREIITDGETGLLFAPGDWNSLAEKLLQLLASEELRDRLAAAGRERARDFERGKIIGQIEALYSMTSDV